MPSYEGSQIIPVRIPADLLKQLDAIIASVNQRRTEEPYHRSTFIRTAVREKIDHYFRARGKRKGAKS